MPPTQPASVLEGVRILELARWQAAPRGGMILRDMGAEVIKLEWSKSSDLRNSGPFVGEMSVQFAAYNRGKKSVTLNTRHPEGKELFYRLLEVSDVVLENFRLVSFIEEPIPAWSTGTAAMMVSVTVGITIPIPNPNRAIATTGTANEESTSINSSTAMPPITIKLPAIDSRRGPKTGPATVTNPAPSIIVPATGTMARPAISAVLPWTN